MQNYTKNPWPKSKSMQAFLPLVLHLYQVNGKIVPPGESQVLYDKTGVTFYIES